MKMQQERSVLAALGTAAVWLGVGVLCSGASAANGTAAAWLWQSGTALAQTAAAVAAARAAGLDRAGLGLVRPGTGGLAPVVFCLALALGSCLAEGPVQGALLLSGGAGRVLAWLRLCPIAALCEELVFRGAVQGLAAPLGRWSVGMQAVLFAAAHGTGAAGLYSLGFGLGLGWLRRRTGSIWPGVLLHGLNNCIVFCLQK